MNKELLNKVLPYCGHGLKAIYEKYVCDVCVSSSGTNKIPAERLAEKSRGGTYHWKPILFSPDCLTRKIETEYGKEIPLIEIAKMIFPGRKWKIDKEKKDSVYDGRYDFLVSYNNNIYHSRYQNGPIPMSMAKYEMIFQYLYSRHIAFNLEPDEYVNVESLEKNPYI